MQTHTRGTIFHRFLTQSLRECRIPHEEESSTSFEQGAGQRQGSMRMDVVTHYGALFCENADGQFSVLMFDITVTNPLGPTAPAQSGT